MTLRTKGVDSTKGPPRSPQDVEVEDEIEIEQEAGVTAEFQVK